MLAPLLALLACAFTPPAEWRVGPNEPSAPGGRILFSADPALLHLAEDPLWLPEGGIAVAPDAAGRVAHEALRNGWAAAIVTADEAGAALLEGTGFESVFVNGERYPGDVYGDGNLRLAVGLRKGGNRLFLRAGRGEFALRLLPAEGPCSLSPHDALLPDLRAGERVEGPGAVVVLNHTGGVLAGATLTVGDGIVFARETHAVPPVLPFGLRKMSFPLHQVGEPAGPDYRLPLLLTCDGHGVSDGRPMALRAAGEAYRETRLSGVDGSVQYHAVRPPERVEAGRRYALYLSLHGAGVEAIGQAQSYRAKADAYVVCPTNRRRFGFDWQDWGRTDALEALSFALARYPIDPDRVYLTGHSMGGHGTWYLGTLHADLFAAIAPSAGWASFFTYGGGLPTSFGRDPDLAPFAWTQAENDTMAFVRNLVRTPIYVLHGEKDDNVPAAQARLFLAALAPFHADHVYHEQPGAGHWWGSECVDWPALFDFCRRHVRNPRPSEVEFSTFDPAVAGRRGFVTVLAATRRPFPCTVRAAIEHGGPLVRVETENVRSLALDLAALPAGERTPVRIDGQDVALDGTGTLFREPGGWRAGAPPPRPTGPFKHAYERNVLLVYGTAGDDAEDAAILAKVRYDTILWWYRGNGDFAVLADRDFDPAAHPGRNVVLYGNADTNSAYAKVLPAAPVSIRRGVVTAGGRAREGDFGLFLAAARGDGGPPALAGVVGATTAKAMRMAQHARYFLSGTAVPDWVVWAPETLTEGMAGVVSSGFFGPDGEYRDPREDLPATR